MFADMKEQTNAVERWQERNAVLQELVRDLEKHNDSEALLVLLNSALSVCERRVYGIQKLERVENYELLERINQIMQE